MILQISKLSVAFPTPHGVFSAVNNVDVDLNANETLAIVGESGSGKSVLVKSILGLLGDRAKVQGTIHFEDENLVGKSPRFMRRIRGRRIALIFQEPLTALNPVMTVGEQIAEVFRTHGLMAPKKARQCALEMMEQVRIPDPKRNYDAYPHALSGGQRQRVVIAMALAGNPDVLLADEPTTALDSTIQGQILDLLLELKTQRKMAMLFITHDMHVVARISDRVMVMYCGRVVESGPTQRVLQSPQHPYTRDLLAAVPQPQQTVYGGDRLLSIPGSVPALHERTTGCPYANRCQHRGDRDQCRNELPPLLERQGRSVACFFAEQGETKA